MPKALPALAKSTVPRSALVMRVAATEESTKVAAPPLPWRTLRKLIFFTSGAAIDDPSQAPAFTDEITPAELMVSLLKPLAWSVKDFPGAPMVIVPLAAEPRTSLVRVPPTDRFPVRFVVEAVML